MADLKGLKRICMSCGARFYDLNKKPIICPSCNTEFTGEIKVKARRGRVADLADEEVEDAAPEAEVETEEVEADEETVSLEEIDEDGDDENEDDIPLDGDDLEIDDEDLDDVDDEDIDEDIAEDEEK